MPTSGTIRIGEADVINLPATDRVFSMVLQSYAFFPHPSVLENVSYELKFSGLSKSETKDREHAGLDIIGRSGYGARLQ